MIRFAGYGFLVASLLACPARAEEVVVGPDGGFYCKEAKYLLEMMEKAIKGEKIALGAGCAELKPGVKIRSDNLEKFDNMAVGRAAIDGNDDVPFIVRVQKPRPTSEGRSYKLVSPDDVRNTPAKWQGRDIEFRNVRVYWVEDSDVRFITNSALTLFASDVRGIDREYLKQNCETQQEAFSPGCRATVRFNYGRHAEDQPTGLAKRTVLISDDVEVIRAASRRR